MQVQRHVDLGLDWTATTVVERIAPQKAAISVEVPLIAGESVLSEGIEVHERPGWRACRTRSGLERGQPKSQWHGGLPRSEQLELATAGAGVRARRYGASP